MRPLDLDGLDGVFSGSADDGPVTARPVIEPSPYPPLALPLSSANSLPMADKQTMSPPSARTIEPKRRSRPWLLALGAIAALVLAVASADVLRMRPSAQQNTMSLAAAVRAPEPSPATPAPQVPSAAHLAPVPPDEAAAVLPTAPSAPPPSDPPIERQLPFRFSFNAGVPAPLSVTETASLESSLRELAARCGPSAPLALVGHTDAAGSAYANQLVGLARAMSVRDLLLRRSGPPVIVASAGSSRPIASNKTREGQRANRRVTAACLPSSPPKESP